MSFKEASLELVRNPYQNSLLAANSKFEGLPFCCNGPASKQYCPTQHIP